VRNRGGGAHHKEAYAWLAVVMLASRLDNLQAIDEPQGQLLGQRLRFTLHLLG